MVLRNIIVFCALMIVFFANSASAENKKISLVEIMPNPDGTDTKTNEFFKLKNYSSESINLEGYKICNISNDCFLLKGEIPFGDCLKIYRTDFVFTLHNDKEELNLFNPDNNLVDKITTGSAPSGESWLCQESYCEWGKPRDTCDYSDIVENVSKDNNNINSNDNVETGHAPSLQEDVLQVNVNNNTAKIKNSNLRITSAKDWKKIENEMSQKNLLSLTVDIRGKITVPYNVVKKNYFYILAGEKLVQANVYSSRQDELINIPLLFQTGTKVKITDGYLKNSQGVWVVGIGKNTQLKLAKGKSNNVETGHAPSLLNNGKSIQDNQGKIVSVSGKIAKKSGQYFYVSDENNQDKVYTVYIPSIVWQKFVVNQNVGIFPEFIKGKVITYTNYIGKEINASGLIEVSGNTYRILVVNEKDISIERENEEDSNKTAGEINNLNINKNSEKSIIPTQNSERAVKDPSDDTSTSSKTPATIDQLKSTLAQKLSWNNIWSILTAKIKLKFGGLFS